MPLLPLFVVSYSKNQQPRESGSIDFSIGGFATIVTDRKGKQKKIYKLKNYLTPYQKLRTLQNWTQYLAPGRTQKELDDICRVHSPTEFAELLQREKIKLFKQFKP